jgi:ATP-binding cassette subfamily B protein
MKWKTVIVIAHRLQTVMNADKIIVMEKWKIIETWNHTELINIWWTYNSLVDLQKWIINE